LAPERDQRAPERDVVGDLLRPADRAEEDRLVAADPILPVVRHHAAVPLVVGPRGEVEMIELEADVEAARRLLENAQSLGNDFGADAVARNDRDPMRLFHAAFSVASLHSSSAGRTTSATPTTVNATPAIMTGVSDSPNIAHAITAVQGGTRYSRLVTAVAS